jgi:DNA-binding response OmpR family regulator
MKYAGTVTTDSKRILIVDDEPLITEAMQMILQRDRHQVEIADSALAALAMFSANRYDLVITDLGLPGLSGAEFAREIRELHPQQPIVCITGDAEGCGSWDTLFNAMIEKPLTIDKLRAVVNSASAAM